MARLTLEQPLRGLILDTKLDDSYRRLPGSLIVDSLEEYDDGLLEEYPFVIVRPQPAEFDIEILDAFLLERYHQLQRVCLVIDELYSVAPGNTPSPGLTALLTRGRTRGLTILSGVQRPAWISQFCFSEADYFAVFRLQLDRDRERLADFGAPEMLDNPLDKYFFWWYKVGEDRAVLHPPLTPLPALAPLPKVFEPEKMRMI